MSLLEIPRSPEKWREWNRKQVRLPNSQRRICKSCYHFSTMSDQYVCLEGAQLCGQILQLSDESIKLSTRTTIVATACWVLEVSPTHLFVSWPTGLVTDWPSDQPTDTEKQIVASPWQKQGKQVGRGSIFRRKKKHSHFEYVTCGWMDRRTNGRMGGRTDGRSQQALESRVRD